MPGQDLYGMMLAKFGYPKSTTLRELISLAFSREEAEIFLQMPAAVDAIAGKLGRDRENVAARLEHMAFVGTVLKRIGRDGQPSYQPVYLMEPFCDSMMHSMGPEYDPETRTFGGDAWNTRIADLWHRFFEEEWYRFARTDELLHRRVALLGGAESGLMFTVTPAWKALAKCSAPPPPDPNYDLRHVVRQIKAEGKNIVAAPCSCKMRARQSAAPLYTCGSFREDRMPAYWAAHPRTIYKTWDPNEWLAMMGVCEEEFGLVHIGVPPNLYDICSCDTECCNIFKPLRTYAHCWEGVEPSPYRAVVDAALCEGRARCVARCRFEAVRLARDPATGKSVAAVDRDRCRGCGQCVLGCELGAVRLELA